MLELKEKLGKMKIKGYSTKNKEGLVDMLIKAEEKKEGNPGKQSACAICKKIITREHFKTIIHENDRARIIKFCSIECFDKKDKWPPIKTRSKKQKSK